MIKQETLDFLKDLADNNHREWFNANKARYEAARDNVVDFTGALIKSLSKVDPGIDASLDPKKCVMRIYRDIRFSLDKTPYKKSFGIGKLQTGKGAWVGYYVHIEPGKSFVAGGSWMPEGDYLKAIRQEIDYNGGELINIVDKPEFKKLFGEFRDQEKLKTLPREYSADNEHIELLKLKSFIAEHSFSDKEIMKADIAEKMADVMAKIYPLNVYLMNAIA